MTISVTPIGPREGTLTVRGVREGDAEAPGNRVDQRPRHDVRSDDGFGQLGLETMARQVAVEFLEHKRAEKLPPRRVDPVVLGKVVLGDRVLRQGARTNHCEVLSYRDGLLVDDIAEVGEDLRLHAGQHRLALRAPVDEFHLVQVGFR